MDEIVNLMKESNHVIVFTGAGMSTESGLPDFRSKNRGLWEKFNPDELANVQALEQNPQEFIEFYQFRLNEIHAYKPHEGHFILANWEKQNRIQGIITQNVDGFHHDAGSKNVMELHGTFHKIYCHICGKNHNRLAYLKGNGYCAACGGPIRPGIVLFGEMLPEDTFLQAEEKTLQSDLFIVLGSSLSVTPANMFPMIAKENGAKLVIVNRESTPLDPYADYLIQKRSVKDFLIEVNKQLKMV
ncbi:NAD-dependent deacylase [Ornithinibacillus salinisoli]|uniref:protein acetyllysine N-acetyltransferase n=1 Tax=Ornithinibacillus salinisoli TaxID=1848459 RepID=A0ABW4VVI9_9BACI